MGKLNPGKYKKTFLKSCKSCFSNNRLFGGSKIALTENGELLIHLIYLVGLHSDNKILYLCLKSS